jgi:hypothetical protein
MRVDSSIRQVERAAHEAHKRRRVLAQPREALDAWAYFSAVGGPNPLTATELITGIIKNPDVIDYLTGDGQSTIADWKK